MASVFGSLFSTSDEQTMWRVKMQDDSQAFARLVSRWESPIQRLCARMTGDPDRARDLCQEVFVRVFTRRAAWEPTGRFSTFLWRIALNLCHDELRKIKRRGESSLDGADEVGAVDEAMFTAETPAPDIQADASERGELVRRAIMKLDPLYREVVVLRHYEQLKFHEIAEALGIPEGTVKSRMAEALTQLRKFLKPLNEDTTCNRKNQTPELRVM